MNPRTTGILFLVALALGAFVWFYEIGGEEARREAAEREKQLFPGVSEDDVAWIALTTSDGRDARFERRGAAWRMVEPLEFPADAAVGRMAEALASVKSESVFSEPQPLSEYGLDEDSARVVRFGTGSGEEAREHEVRFGDATPVGARTYAATGEGDAVYTVEGYRAKAFEKSLADLRDKQIAEFDRAAIQEVEVRWPDARVVVERTGEDGEEGEGEWRMTAPLDARADDAALRSLLSNLSFLRAEAFVDAPTDAQRALLDPPAVEVRLVPAAPEAEPVDLAVSRTAEGETRLVRAGGDTLYEIPAERIADIPREVVAYRYRTLARFALSEAQQVDFFFQPPVGDPVAITAERSDAGWASRPEDFAPGKLPRLVSELSRLVAEDILAEDLGEAELEALGLSPPTTILSVFGARPEAADAEEGGAEPAPAPKLAEVHLGRVTDEGIVARPAGASTVYRLPRDLVQHIPVDLAAFRSQFRAEEEETAAEEQASDVPGPAGELPSPREESP